MEDDLAIIQSNGLAYRTDDHSNTAAGATTLAASSSFTASGFIGRAGDVDALSVSVGAGRLAVQVAPIARGPNLDIALELRDAAGALFASAQPFATLGANIDVIVPAGIYTLSIKGVGAGTPATGYSDYASFGQWKLTGTAVPGDSTTPQPVAPIASFTLSSTHGTAPLAVVFDGSSSTDSDGTIASYAWSFGDGTLATGVTASHAYTTAGTYTTSLTVTDSQGLTATTARQVVVSAPNVAPVARVTATPVSGTAPLTVAFSGSGSADADGSIVSYAWSFGDGVSATGLAVSHTYTKPGTYTARLTVTDNASATASASTQIVVSPAVTDTLRVAAITMIVVPLKADRYVQARVVVLDAGGQPVSGATVKGAWAGIVTGTSTGMTGADGSVLLSSKRTRKSGTITFTVTSVAKTAYTYASDENEVTLASLALPPTVK
jgi:PKD repeat protein